MSFISVIICTHNPRRDYLLRVLDGLKAQSLPTEQWELLLIDNASNESLASAIDLSWHPGARHVREEELGLTKARIRGIKESVGEVQVFVDDDNLLSPIYLEHALKIAKTESHLGVWGGNVELEFERKPMLELEPYCALLALKTVIRPIWSNLYTFETAPVGAGICVRSSVSKYYMEKVRADEIRRSLDREGNGFGSCGDLDLCWTAVDIGMGCGLFPEFKVAHLIGKHRVELDYLMQLQKGTCKSYALLRSSRKLPMGDIYPLLSKKRKIIERLKLLRVSKLRRLFTEASWQGEAEAFKIISDQS